MDEQEKAKVRAVAGKVAGKVAEAANERGKAATGWKKWVWGALAVIAGAIAYFTTGCTASVSQAADGSWSYTGVIVMPVEGGK